MKHWALSLLLIATPAAAEPPAKLEITFEMTRNGSSMAEVVERLEYSGGQYQLTETWKGKGIYALLGRARRVSQGTIDQTALRPREFFDERSGRDTARAWFDWNARTLTMQYKGERKTEPLQPDGQDRLSFLLALSLLPGKGASVSYHIADGKGISHHVYQVEGPERLSTPVGEFDTVRVLRTGGKDDRDSARVWLARELAYVPVKLLVTDGDGNRYEQTPIRISR